VRLPAVVVVASLDKLPELHCELPVASLLAVLPTSLLVGMSHYWTTAESQASLQAPMLLSDSQPNW